MHKITPPSSSASMRSPIHLELAPLKKAIKPDDPPQNVDISHLSDPTSTITNLDETYPLDTSCDHLCHLVSPSLSSELQDTSSVENVEIDFLPESEGKLDHTNLSPTDVFSGHHDYELFLLQKEIDQWANFALDNVNALKQQSNNTQCAVTHSGLLSKKTC